MFKVQIASSPRKLATESKNFKGLTNIEREFRNDRYKYYAGNSNSFKKIVILQNEVRKKYPDAFVTAFKNNKQITLKQALGE